MQTSMLLFGLLLVGALGADLNHVGNHNHDGNHNHNGDQGSNHATTNNNNNSPSQFYQQPQEQLTQTNQHASNFVFFQQQPQVEQQDLHQQMQEQMEQKLNQQMQIILNQQDQNERLSNIHITPNSDTQQNLHQDSQFVQQLDNMVIMSQDAGNNQFLIPSRNEQVQNNPSQIYQQPDSVLNLEEFLRTESGTGELMQLSQVVPTQNEQVFVSPQFFTQDVITNHQSPNIEHVMLMQSGQEGLLNNNNQVTFSQGLSHLQDGESLPSLQQSFDIPQTFFGNQNLMLQLQNNEEPINIDHTAGQTISNINEEFDSSLPFDQNSFHQVQTLPQLLNPEPQPQVQIAVQDMNNIIDNHVTMDQLLSQISHSQSTAVENPVDVQSQSLTAHQIPLLNSNSDSVQNHSPLVNTKPLERPSSSVKPLSRSDTKFITNTKLTSCAPGLLADLNGNCVEPHITRNVFLYAAPRIEKRFRARVSVPKPKLEYNIVFVRNPVTQQDVEPIVVPPPQQKTLVYVLNKKSEAREQGLIEAPSHPRLQPEVYFVNYGEGENPELPGGVDLRSALQEMVLEGTVIDNFSNVPILQESDIQDQTGTQEGQIVNVIQEAQTNKPSDDIRGYEYPQQNIS